MKKNPYPPCPKCQSPQTRLANKSATGSRRIICKTCNSTSTLMGNPTGHKRNPSDECLSTSHSLTVETLAAMNNLPQIKTLVWSRSYFLDQLLRQSLGLLSEYSQEEMRRVLSGEIVTPF